MASTVQRGSAAHRARARWSEVDEVNVEGAACWGWVAAARAPPRPQRSRPGSGRNGRRRSGIRARLPKRRTGLEAGCGCCAGSIESVLLGLRARFGEPAGLGRVGSGRHGDDEAVAGLEVEAVG